MKKIFVAGHNGMVGSALVRKLSKDKNISLITASRSELDLTNYDDVYSFLQIHKVDEVYLAAAKVGGIHANNTYPADFITENIQIQTNVIKSSHAHKINKLLFLGSSCIYPKSSEQPMSEDSLLTGKLEATNEPYAIAKIAGIKMCESFNRQYGVDYRCVMPTNLYGINDNFHYENSHVIPAMMRRFHEAKLKASKHVEIWGSGKPLREFLHVDDMASASIFVMNIKKEDFISLISNPMCSHINVGSGIDLTILELAKIMSCVVGYDGKIILNKSKPDGTPRKLMDISRLSSLGWNHSIQLEEGLQMTYKWFLQNINDSRM
jgi:GDP-L-fucose synthase